MFSTYLEQKKILTTKAYSFLFLIKVITVYSNLFVVDLMDILPGTPKFVEPSLVGECCTSLLKIVNKSIFRRFPQKENNSGTKGTSVILSTTSKSRIRKQKYKRPYTTDVLEWMTQGFVCKHYHGTV